MVTVEQQKALYRLKDLRNWFEGCVFDMASIEFGRINGIQKILLKELYDNYEDTDTSLRFIVKKAFGVYPFERANWDVFEEWFVYLTETDKVDFLFENGIISEDTEDYVLDEVGYPEWVKHCIYNAKNTLNSIIKQIDEFLKEHEVQDNE